MSFDSHRSDNISSSPLDVWIKEAPSAAPVISDEDLEARIRASAASHGKPTSQAAASSHILDNLAKAIGNSEHDNHVDTAVRAAANGVKVLAPLLTAIVKWVPPERSDEISGIMGAVLERVRWDSNEVVKAFGVEPDDAPVWLNSQVSGMIMPILVNAVDRNNGVVLDPNDSRYLIPILNLAKQAKDAGLAYPSQPISTEWQLIQALSSATATVLTEYHAFTYFHEDAESVAQTISDFLQDRVVYQTLADLTNQWGLNEKERAYIGCSLLAQSGNILAKCWTEQSSVALDNLKEQSREVRNNALVNGYPLDHVFDAFERVYRGVEWGQLSALRSLIPNRERVHLEPSNAPGMR